MLSEQELPNSGGGEEGPSEISSTAESLETQEDGLARCRKTVFNALWNTGEAIFNVMDRIGEGVAAFIGLDDSRFQDILDNMTEEEMNQAILINEQREMEYHLYMQQRTAESSMENGGEAAATTSGRSRERNSGRHSHGSHRSHRSATSSSPGRNRNLRTAHASVVTQQPSGAVAIVVPPPPLTAQYVPGTPSPTTTEAHSVNSHTDSLLLPPPPPQVSQSQV